MQDKLSFRWRVKDLAQLLFSAGDCAGGTDIMRFWKVYCDRTGSDLFKDRRLIRAIFPRLKGSGRGSPGSNVKANDHEPIAKLVFCRNSEARSQDSE